MAGEFDHQKFAWSRVEDLLGLPRHDRRVQDLFARAGLMLDDVAEERRVGIESMPPRDKQPAAGASRSAGVAPAPLSLERWTCGGLPTAAAGAEHEPQDAERWNR